MYVMLTFLEVNGIRMDCTNDDVVRTGLGVAASVHLRDAAVSMPYRQSKRFESTQYCIRANVSETRKAFIPYKRCKS